MKKFQSKIKSIVLIGLFVFLFVGFSFSTPTPAAASMDVVSTQITYHSQSQAINAELTDTVQATSEMQIAADSLEVESTQLETVGEDDDWSWNAWLKWLKKTGKKALVGFSLAWSG